MSETQQENIELKPLTVWEPDLVRLLKSIYSQVDRKYITWDVFANNVRSAAAKATLPEFIETLCRKVGVCLPSDLADAKLIRRLIQYTDEILTAINDSASYYVVAARGEEVNAANA